MSEINENKIVHFNSVISLSLITESSEKKSSMYIIRREELDESLLLRELNPLSDFTLMKDALFTIKKLREENLQENESENIQSQRINYNQQFILQHLVSKKYLSKNKLNGNNNYKLKLVEKEELAIPFAFKQIVETRSSQNFITINQIIYLSVYIKEKSQYFYINKSCLKNKENAEFAELDIEKDMINKFIIINQSCFNQKNNYIYSGELINIKFKIKEKSKEDVCLLGVECQKEIKNDDLISLKEEVKEDIDNFSKENGNQMNDFFELKYDNKNTNGKKFVKSFTLQKDYNNHEHINNFSFWVIEEENFNNQTKPIRKPLLPESYVRIKNPLLGLYLTVKPKVDSANEEYEFDLVEEKNLMPNSAYYSNFQIYHYSINMENKKLTDGGKYIIKTIFKDKPINDFNKDFEQNFLNKNFESVSLEKDNADDKLIVKNGEEFIFEISKINIYDSNEVIYLKKIVDHLDFLVQSYNKKCYNQNNVIDVISKHITFFTNYLINLDYSFKDINSETNYPIKYRQELLKDYNILKIINEIINYFLPSLNIQKEKKKKIEEFSGNTIKKASPINENIKNNDNINSSLKALMSQILTFYTYLLDKNKDFLNNDEKKENFFLYMKNILELCEYLFKDNLTILLNFIFIILKDSQTLQENLLSENENDKNIIVEKKNKNLIKIHKIFEYLKISHNFLYFYKKIMTLNCVSFKRDYISKKIKDNMKEIDNKSFEENYNRILKRTVNEIKSIINEREIFLKKKLKTATMKLNNFNMINDDPKDLKEIILKTNDYLENYKKIKKFLKFFDNFHECKFNNALFLLDIFKNELTNKSKVNKEDYLDKKLNLIIQNDIKPEKVISEFDIDINSQLAPIFPLHFYNIFFPKVEEKILQAIDKNKNEDEEQIENEENNLNEINTNTHKNNNNENNNINNSDDNSNNNLLSESNNEENEKNENEEEKQKQQAITELNKRLCIVYSIYIFCINQYYEAVYKIYKLFKNILINYESFGKLELIDKYLKFIRFNLLDKIVFIENPILMDIIKNCKENPSIINYKYDYDEQNISESSDEFYIIRFLFYFARINDKIKFFFEKINNYHLIRTLSNVSINESELNENFHKITTKLNLNRQKLLCLYQNLNLEKNKLIAAGHFNSTGINAYTIQKRIKFVTKLLGKYDIAKYFDKIIFIRTDEFLRTLKTGSYEFNNISEQIDKINNKENSKDKIDIQDEKIIDSLKTISNQFKTFTNDQRTFKEDTGKKQYTSTIKIESMLIKEDKSYFEKINFPNKLEKLISITRDFNQMKQDNSLNLKFCNELLKIFINLTKNSDKFNKLIKEKEKIEIYEMLIKNSLSVVKNYQNINSEIVLSVVYNASNAFLYFVENSKIKFVNLKKFMRDIFILHLKIFDIYKDLKNNIIKVYYLIFYSYLVSRVLLFLNKDKEYDFYNYENFFREIYKNDKDEMKNRILTCIEELTDEEFDENSDDFQNEYNESIDKDLNNSESKKSKNFGDFNFDKDSLNNLKKKRELIFCLNFLTIYIIYLNELNSVRQSITSNKLNGPTFKFKNLKDKIKVFLDGTQNKSIDNEKDNNNDSFDEKNSMSKSEQTQMRLNQITNTAFSNTNTLNQNIENIVNTNNNNNQNLNIETKFKKNTIFVKNDYEFESVLLESIIYYKLNRELLEIKIVENNRNKFYYYDTNVIDLILIEKILRDIQIQEQIKKFFDDEPNESILNYEEEEEENNNNNNIIKHTNFTLNSLFENNNSLINILIQNSEEYLLITQYDSDEKLYFEILHEQFIKSNMMKLINNLVKRFDKNDMDEIKSMKLFNYVKLNEMYPSSEEKNNNNLNNEINEKSLVQTLLDLDFKDSNDDVDFNNFFSKTIKEYNFDLNKIFSSIMYFYRQNEENLAILIYKISFKIFQKVCEDKKLDVEIDYVELINSLIKLLQREKNKKIIQDKNLFFIILNSISKLLILLNNEKNNFVIKNLELIKKLFESFKMIFEYLTNDLEKIVKFIKNSESAKMTDKLKKKEDRIKKIIFFITNVLDFNSFQDTSILSNEMKNYNSKIVEKIIKLISILLQYNRTESHQTILILIDFLNNFIKGPDIENLNLLFNKGYFELMQFAINNIDYYELFIKNINKPKLCEYIDSMIEIEYKIMKIFFIYFNIAHHGKKDLILKVRKFYEENLENIKNKLKRIYYISSKELENEKYDFDKLILFNSGNDFYSNDDLVIKANIILDDKEEIKIKNKEKQEIKNQNNIYLIKFEIILTYYTLYILQKEVIFENYFNITSLKSTFYEDIYKFFSKLFLLVFNLILTPFYLVKMVISFFVPKKISIVSLYEKLYDIDEKYKNIDENSMMTFMKQNITSVEVVLNKILYKCYFPLLTKSKKIKENQENYFQIDSDKLKDYIYQIMNNYDKINIEVTQNYKLDSFFEIPILRILFVNTDLFKTLSLITAIITNFLIMASYSVFAIDDKDCDKKEDKKRVECPELWFENGNYKQTISLLKNFGITQLIITSIMFINYYFRVVLIQLKDKELKYKLKIIKKNKTKNISLKFFSYLNYIIIPAIFKSFINFESLFYILALGFSLLGIIVHPFFYGFMLVELVVRIEVMKNVLLAIYVPRQQIIITLILFLVLIYFFSLFALQYFTSHFPNQKDTNTFLKTYLRMFDQTFKQDGGIGTYLDQSQDPNYVPYIPKAFVGLRFWFDNIFYYIILLLIFQMFLSIIIDYFGNQRENQEEFTQTVESQCLICGSSREDLEKIYSNHKSAFQIHTNYDHNVCDYICYLVYLQSLTNRDQNVEEPVWKMHLNNNYLFLPKQTCFKMIERATNKKNDIKEED